MIARFFIFFLTASVLYGDVRAHSVHELIDATLQSHPTIQASRQMIKSAEAGVEGAKWGYFPTPSVELSQGSGRQGVTLRLDQPLWTGGKLDAAYEIATLQKSESELVLDESAYMLIETLLQNIQNYYQSQGTMRALQEGKEQLLALSAMLARRIEAGVSSQADRELILSRISTITADLDAATMRRDMALQQIELISGVRLDAPPAFDPLLVSSQRVLFSSLADEIRTTHPSLKKLAVRIKLAQAERDKAKAVLWPNISLRAEHLYGSVYSDTKSSDSLVYLAVQMSPGAGLSALSAVQSAEAKILQSQFEYQSKERELIDAAIRDFSTYQSAQEQIAGMKQTIQAAQNVFDSYTRLFVAGKRQWLDLVNASRELTQYKTSLAQLEGLAIALAYQLALKRGKITLFSKGVQ